MPGRFKFTFFVHKVGNNQSLQSDVFRISVVGIIRSLVPDYRLTEQQRAVRWCGGLVEITWWIFDWCNETCSIHETDSTKEESRENRNSTRINMKK